MSELRRIYLGHLRAMLDDPFWTSDAGVTFFRALPNETVEDVVASMYTFVDALSGGDDNAVAHASDDPAAVVTARTYAFVELSRERLCRAAARARDDLPSQLRPPDKEVTTEALQNLPAGWVRLANPETSDTDASPATSPLQGP